MKHDVQRGLPKWLGSSALSEAEKEELRSIANDEKEIESRFFAPLEFGTAGSRGTMCVGLHQMNIHVIRHATQAFAEVILAEGGDRAAGHRSLLRLPPPLRRVRPGGGRRHGGQRHQGAYFRHPAAHPGLSFAVREYGCIAGINVTASHNPKEYNGYKVYWEDGAQLPPHHAAAIAAKMEELDLFDSIRRWTTMRPWEAGMIAVMGDGDRREVPVQRDESGQRQGGRGEGGGHLQNGLHPIPRHGVQAYPGGFKAAGDEARHLRTGADGD